MGVIDDLDLYFKVKKLIKLFKEEVNMKNWQTTLTGLFGAIAYAVTSYLTDHNVTIPEIINAVVIAALGFFAKDRNVTGGTIKQ